MEFEYMDCIYIDPSDLRQMYLRVKHGEEFSDVFDDITCGYDDYIYYACNMVKDQVHAEIQRRLNQSKNQQKGE